MKRSFFGRFAAILRSTSGAGLVGAAAILLSGTPAAAQERELGRKGNLSFDSIFGFRASSNLSPAIFAGPIGFAFQRYSETNFQPVGGETSVKATTFWLAPTADYFVIDHLSVGGTVELGLTSSSIETAQAGRTTTVDLPGTTSITLLPRVGYLIPITERFSIWPRGGVGYASRQTVTTTATTPVADTFSAAVLAIDVGFLFQFSDVWYLRAGPDFATSLGGSHSVSQGGTTTSAGASYLQFGGAAGLGIMLDL